MEFSQADEDNMDERKLKHEIAEHQRALQEASLIEEETNEEEEKQEDLIYDALIIFLGVCFLLISLVIYITNEFRGDISVYSTLVFGIVFLSIGISWRYYFKRHISRPRKDLSAIEEEIERL